jgi:RNA polymerase sigma-70 factor (ECF subfamily)
VLVEPSEGELARRDRDRALVEAHCNGDPDAFTLIVQEHHQALVAQAQRRLGTRNEAEDAVQEVFERAYRGLCRFGGEYRLGAWLGRICANVCSDHAGRRHLQRRLPDRLGMRNLESPGHDATEDASDPVVLRAVSVALAALPPSQRHTFLLRELDGLSYPQVAERLGISEDNARARVHRAKTALRRQLGAVGGTAAGLIAIPFRLRDLLRRVAKLAGAHTPHAAPSLPPNGELVRGAASSLPTLQLSTSQAIAHLAAGPGSAVTSIGEMATSVASSGPSSLAVIAAGVATAIGSVFAGPAITGTTAAAGDTVPVKTEVTTSEVTTGNVLTAAVATTPATPAPPSSGSAMTPDVPSWVTDGADAKEAAGPAVPVSLAPAESAPCSWLRDYPGIVPSAPGTAPLVGTLVPPDFALGAQTTSVEVATDAVLRVKTAAGGVPVAVPVHFHALSCLVPGQTVIVIDLVGDAGKAQLRGALVVQQSDSQYVFRGTVTSVTDIPGATVGLPWGLSDRFVALLEVDLATKSASLNVAFLDVVPVVPGSAGGSGSPASCSAVTLPGNGATSAVAPGSTTTASTPADTGTTTSGTTASATTTSGSSVSSPSSQTQAGVPPATTCSGDSGTTTSNSASGGSGVGSPTGSSSGNDAGAPSPTSSTTGTTGTTSTGDPAPTAATTPTT